MRWAGTLGKTGAVDRGGTFEAISARSEAPTAWTISFNLTSAEDSSNPDPFVEATVSYGVAGARQVVVGDWQPGARIALVADELVVTGRYRTDRDPTAAALQVLLACSATPGAWVAPSSWGRTVISPPIAGGGGTTLIAVPSGATDVLMLAPTQASWGAISIGQRSGATAANFFTRAPTSPETYPILAGARWIQLVNAAAGALSPVVRFGLTT
jgi:hypothetical protein